MALFLRVFLRLFFVVALLFMGPILMFIILLATAPVKFDEFFARSSDAARFLRYQYESELSIEGVLSLPIKNSKYNIFCVVPKEVNPFEEARNDFGTDINIEHEYSGINGWDDMNWHITSVKDKEVVVVSMPSYMFPSDDGASCTDHITLVFDRTEKRVLVKSTGAAYDRSIYFPTGGGLGNGQR